MGIKSGASVEYFHIIEGKLKSPKTNTESLVSASSVVIEKGMR